MYWSRPVRYTTRAPQSSELAIQMACKLGCGLDSYAHMSLDSRTTLEVHPGQSRTGVMLARRIKGSYTCDAHCDRGAQRGKIGGRENGGEGEGGGKEGEGGVEEGE